MPTIGVYQMSFGSFAAESVGATRWLFDTLWHVPYTMLTNHDIANGGLHGIDVLVAPGGDFPTALQYLGATGAKALKDFVNHGGRYVGYRGGGARLMAALGITTAGFQGFYPSITIDGTLVRMAVDPSSPLAKGVGPLAWGLFDAYDAYMYAPRRSRRSGSPPPPAATSPSRASPWGRRNCTARPRSWTSSWDGAGWS